MSSKFYFRHGMADFLCALDQRNAKLHVISAGVVGVIKQSLEMLGTGLEDKVECCGTEEEYDRMGVLVGFKEPTVTALNKSSVVTHSALPHVRPGSNAILMGDLIPDLLMTENLKLSTTLTIGFYNGGKGASLEEYKKSFDVLVMGDGNLDWVTSLINA